MCGICGFISLKPNGPDKADAYKMLKSNESRGGHAWGMAWQEREGKQPGIWYVKDAGKVPTREGIVMPNTQVCIMHTRFATHGKPEINENNHPHVSASWAIVHNGVLSGKHGSQKTECDSEQVLKYLIQFEHRPVMEAIKMMVDKISGSFRLGIINANYPNKLWIVCDSEEIWLGKNQQAIWFASEKKDLPKDCWFRKTEEWSITEFEIKNSAITYHSKKLEKKYTYGGCMDWNTYRGHQLQPSRRNNVTITKGDNTIPLWNGTNGVLSNPIDGEFDQNDQFAIREPTVIDISNTSDFYSECVNCNKKCDCDDCPTYEKMKKGRK